jgi:thiol-disulfide isomerase/thioredoxin
MKKFFLIILLLILGSVSSQSAGNIGLIHKDKLDSLIKNRDGNLLLINIWATWCIPCREEFPDLIKIAENFADDLDVIAVSVDFADEKDSKIIPFLKDKKVNFPVFISGFEKDEEMINYFSKEWNGALPATFIYNRQGNQIEFLEGKHSYESFSSVIRNLL